MHIYDVIELCEHNNYWCLFSVIYKLRIAIIRGEFIT